MQQKGEGRNLRDPDNLHLGKSRRLGLMASNVCSTSATVTSVQLWACLTVTAKVPILFAFIALETPSKAILPVPGIWPVQPLQPALLPVPASAASHLHLSLLCFTIRAFSGKVAGFVAPVADRSRVPALWALPGKMPSLLTSIANRNLLLGHISSIKALSLVEVNQAIK